MPKILVIEDEEPIRENIIETLELDGFQVFGAPNGRDGVALALAEKPDLIICDIMMQHLDGYGVLEEVRKHEDTASIPFIFITAKADRQSMRQGMELGADDYITKPFTTAELLSAVHMRMRRHQAISTESMRALEQLQRQLVQVVAHELRTPLTSINMAVELLWRDHDDLAPDQVESVIDTLATGNRRLNRLVEQMVYMVQLEGGMLNGESIAQHGYPTPLWSILIASINMAKSFAQRRSNINVTIDEHNPGTYVLCDQRALEQAFAELIANAIAYSPDGMQVAVTQWLDQGRLWISIVDHGQGMTPEQIEQAFKAFTQIDREKNEQQGMGLGLSLAQRIITLHGGTLDLHSAPGEGTQVTVTLPPAEL